jgi:hypothetical protein
MASPWFRLLARAFRPYGIHVATQPLKYVPLGNALDKLSVDDSRAAGSMDNVQRIVCMSYPRGSRSQNRSTISRRITITETTADRSIGQ